MKAIIFNNDINGNSQFKKIENEIHNALKIIKGYGENTDRWTEKQYSIDKSKIALIVETDGIRGEIISGIIKGFEVTEIQNTDAFWFNQEILKMEK